MTARRINIFRRTRRRTCSPMTTNSRHSGLRAVSRFLWLEHREPAVHARDGIFVCDEGSFPQIWAVTGQECLIWINSTGRGDQLISSVLKGCAMWRGGVLKFCNFTTLRSHCLCLTGRLLRPSGVVSSTLWVGLGSKFSPRSMSDPSHEEEFVQDEAWRVGGLAPPS